MKHNDLDLRDPIFRYIVLGVSIGILGVILSTIIAAVEDGLSFSFANLILTQRTRKVLWFIDLLPLALGFIFAVLGTISHRLQRSRAELEILVTERTQELTQINQKLLEENQERLKVETILSRAKKEWEVIFDAVKDMILIVDQLGTIVRCNRSVIEHFGKTFQEVIGKNINEIFYGDTEEAAPRLDYMEDFCQFPTLEVWPKSSCFSGIGSKLLTSPSQE